MKQIEAYELIMKEEIADIHSSGYLLRHKKSGARVMLLANEDDNKVFNIAFRTTPTDSTGVAHIMEHTVLCGSRRFPAKDPFVELVKGSMNTFLNAMTYPDKTMFPVASCNDADFANLMHVYMDAVFYPNIYIKEEIFRQEGWHYQLENPEDELVYNGVVYNEMKGAYSSPDDVLERRIMNSLFPDNTYAFESGGDPECIPDLTYEDYLDFHRKYYHPSNSYIYLYGDMDFTERLIWLDREYLSHFDAIAVDSEIPLQKAYDEMRRVECSYPISNEDTPEKNTYLAFNAAIGTSLDTKLAGAFAVLKYALLETPGAPLKEALLDAGIGRDIMSSYDSGIRQPVFSVIAKNAEAEDAERFYEIIMETLHRVVKDGLDERALRAAVNTMEFSFREADYGTYPKGLIYGIDVFDSWLYDDKHPFDYLKQGADYAFLKEKIGTGYFEELISIYLIDNCHETLLICRPEKGLAAKAEQTVSEKLSAFKASLSDEQIRKIIDDYRRLRVFQETPSTQEELRKIPMLTREDMRRQIRPISNVESKTAGITVLSHHYSTNGIVYMHLMLDASTVAREDLPYLGILRAALGMVSTAHYSYKALQNEINVQTGGISPTISVYGVGDDPEKARAAFGMKVRTLSDQIAFSWRMIEEILFTSDLREEKRLLEILQKMKSRMRVHLAEAGNATAAMRTRAQFSAAAQFNEAVSGIEFFRTVEDIADHFEEKKEELMTALERVMSTLLQKGSALVSFTGSEKDLSSVRPCIEHFAERLDGYSEGRIRETGGSPIALYNGMTFSHVNEGYGTPGKVQYVARSGNYRNDGYTYHGALRVLRTIMSYDYLWNNVRVMGGAYGCGAAFGPDGSVVLSSYRDPHLKRTDEIYEGIPSYLREFTCDERDMTKYVIGTFSEMDTPLNPSALGSRDLSMYLSETTEEMLQKARDEVYSATQEDIRALAPLLESALKQRYFCVVGNEDKLQENQEMFDHIENL